MKIQLNCLDIYPLANHFIIFVTARACQGFSATSSYSGITILRRDRGLIRLGLERLIIWKHKKQIVEACSSIVDGRPIGIRSKMDSTRSVKVNPGATTFTVIPCGAHSNAHCLVKPICAAFAAVKSTPPNKVNVLPGTADTFTILPHPCFFIIDATTRVQLKTCRRFNSIVIEVTLHHSET